MYFWLKLLLDFIHGVLIGLWKVGCDIIGPLHQWLLHSLFSPLDRNYLEDCTALENNKWVSIILRWWASGATVDVIMRWSGAFMHFAWISHIRFWFCTKGFKNCTHAKSSIHHKSVRILFSSWNKQFLYYALPHLHIISICTLPDFFFLFAKKVLHFTQQILLCQVIKT